MTSKINESNVNISNMEETDEILRFTLSNINVSYANAIRRTLLSDIPIYVFKTQPYEENKVNIIVNKTRLNNEIIKQRISSIPLHIKDLESFPFNDYIFEINKENNTNEILYVTSEDFKIKNIKTNKYLDNSEVKTIFPPNKITGDYIDIVRLNPKISDSIKSCKLKLEAKIEISNAKEDGMFNVVSTCSYGNTPDPIKIDEKWKEKSETLKDKHSKEELEFLKKDWLLLDAKRIYIENSFDFIIESIGIYNNIELVNLACQSIIKKLYFTLENIKNKNNLITKINDTMDNCYVITLENEDYTVGKIIEYCLYNKYFEETKELLYVGFLKKHPHDTFSIIKLSFKNITNRDNIIIMLEECVNKSIILLNSIKEYFSVDL